MKRVWISVGITALMIVWVIFCNLSLKRLSAQITEQLELAETKAADGNFDDAGVCFDRAYQKWNDAEAFLGSIAKHNELDQIAVDLEQAAAYFARGEYNDFISLTRAARRRIGHIEQMESLSLGNIF